MKKLLFSIPLAMTLALSFALPAQAAAIRNASSFTTNSLAANDDGSTGLVNIGFNIDFFGVRQNNLFVNNNGNVTFAASLGQFTPFGLITSTIAIIAPFFADVDTRAPGSGVVQYGQATIGGRSVFGVNWINVGVYNSLPIFNSFQLIMTNRSDVRFGDFDFEFNYDNVVWETGQASGGNGQGLGGNSARVGYTNGGAVDFEFAGSGVNGAFLNAGNRSLVRGSLNSNVAGRYIFNVRNGAVVPPPMGVPEPMSLALVGLALVALAASSRKKCAA